MITESSIIDHYNFHSCIYGDRISTFQSSKLKQLLRRNGDGVISKPTFNLKKKKRFDRNFIYLSYIYFFIKMYKESKFSIESLKLHKLKYTVQIPTIKIFFSYIILVADRRS